MPTLAIVGAGLTGLSAAQRARERGWKPLLIDKECGPGGRLATQSAHGAALFDTGAQFFSVRDPAFAAAVSGWASAGVAEPWSTGFPVLTAAGLSDGSDGHVRWRIAGGMNALAKHLVSDLDLRTQCTVSGVRAAAGRWQVALTPDATVQADALLLTQPVPQILALLSASSVVVPAAFAERLNAVRYDPCLCLLFDRATGDALLPEPGGVRIDDPASPVSWIASQRRKGLRSTGEGLVVHFRGAWSAERFERSAAALLSDLRDAAEVILARLGITIPDAVAQVTKWRYSLATITMAESCLSLDPGAPLLLAGDAFGDKPRMEGAWLSGQAAAECLTARAL